MATQPFLEAVRGGSFTTPTDWEALADQWEASSFSAEDSKAWVDVQIEAPAVASVLVSRNVTPEDVSLIVAFFTPTSLPPLQDALAAIAFLKAFQGVGRTLTAELRVRALQSFFGQLRSTGVTISV